MNVQDMLKVAKQIEKFYAEDRYTDIDGNVWLGRGDERWYMEGKETEEDAAYWLTNRQMLKKMSNELSGDEQFRRDEAVRIEALYEYNIRVVSPYATEPMILYNVWITKKQMTDFWAGQTRPANFTLVRRLKAGPVEEVTD
jgi:hypothetical protein